MTDATEYYGKYLGPLKSYHHGLGGNVYAVDARTLHVRNFVYDGEGPGNVGTPLFGTGKLATVFYVKNRRTTDRTRARNSRVDVNRSTRPNGNAEFGIFE